MGRHERICRTSPLVGVAPRCPIGFVVEMFCRADHGRCWISARSGWPDTTEVETAGSRGGEFDAVQYQKVISLVAAELCLNEELTNPWADLRPPSWV